MEDPMTKLEEVVSRVTELFQTERYKLVKGIRGVKYPELSKIEFLEDTCVGKVEINGDASQEVLFSGNFLLEFILAINSWCQDETQDEENAWVWFTPGFPHYNEMADKTVVMLHPTNADDIPLKEFVVLAKSEFEQRLAPRLEHIVRVFLANQYYGYGLYTALFEAKKRQLILADELRDLLKKQLDNFLLLYGILPAESKNKSIKARNKKEFKDVRERKRATRNAKRHELIARLEEQLAPSPIAPACA